MDFDKWLKLHGFVPGNLSAAMRNSLQTAWKAEQSQKRQQKPRPQVRRQMFLQSVICTDDAVDTNSDPFDLGPYVNKWVRLDDGICYHVTIDEECAEPLQQVTVVQGYDVCSDCLPCYELTNCDTEDVITTSSDLSEYSVGDVLRRDASEDGGCWEITNTGVTCSDPETFTPTEDGPYTGETACADCGEEPPPPDCICLEQNGGEVELVYPDGFETCVNVGTYFTHYTTSGLILSGVGGWAAPAVAGGGGTDFYVKLICDPATDEFKAGLIAGPRNQTVTGNDITVSVTHSVATITARFSFSDWGWSGSGPPCRPVNEYIYAIFRIPICDAPPCAECGTDSREKTGALINIDTTDANCGCMITVDGEMTWNPLQSRWEYALSCGEGAGAAVHAYCEGSDWKVELFDCTGTSVGSSTSFNSGSGVLSLNTSSLSMAACGCIDDVSLDITVTLLPCSEP